MKRTTTKDCSINAASNTTVKKFNSHGNYSIHRGAFLYAARSADLALTIIYSFQNFVSLFIRLKLEFYKLVFFVKSFKMFLVFLHSFSAG